MADLAALLEDALDAVGVQLGVKSRYATAAARLEAANVRVAAPRSEDAAAEQCCWFRVGHGGPHEHPRSDPAAPLRGAITSEHRECGKPRYDGCFSHLPGRHCRACGMALPCDVMRLAALGETA